MILKSANILAANLVRSSLPEGWRKEVVQRKSGTSAGKFDTYIFRYEVIVIKYHV